MAFPIYDELNAPGSYGEFRYSEVLEPLWGENLKPYLGADDKPLIGPNFDLEAHLFEAMLVITGSSDSDLYSRLFTVVDGHTGSAADLRKDLDAALVQYARDHELSGFATKFEFTGRDKLKDFIDMAMSSIEDSLASWGDVGVPVSEERAVLASLLHGGIDPDVMDDIMENLLFDGDRAGAWYDIRYIQWDDEVESAPGKAEANRRYFQSDVFELYNDPGSVDHDEAEDVGLMYTEHRLAIRQYEKEYDPGNGSVPGQGDIVSELQPAIRAVAESYNIQIGKMEELLYVGRSTGYDGQSGNIEDKRHDADLVIGDLGSDTLIGGKGNDVLLGDPEDNGEGGQDDLIDGGKGNDRLYGGADGDTLLGGGGKDRLYGGGGTDHLEGGKGNDTYYLTDNSLTDVGGPEGSDPTLVGGVNDDVVKEGAKQGKDTIEVWVSSGDFNVRHIEKFRLAGDISGSVSVMLNQFDDFILSTGDDQLSLTINKLQKKPIDIVTNGGADTITIEFEPGVDPSRVLDGKGLTARFRFDDLTADDTIDLTSIGIEDVIMNRDRITDDRGFYLMAPGAKLDFMVGGKIDKTYNNSTDSWFVVKCGTDTPYGPEFIGDIDRSHFDF